MCTKFGQNPLKDVDSRVFTRMLRKDGQTDVSITISLRNFVGRRIIMSVRAFDIFQAYHYFTIYRGYFFLKFEQFNILYNTLSNQEEPKTILGR